MEEKEAHGEIETEHLGYSLSYSRDFSPHFRIIEFLVRRP